MVLKWYCTQTDWNSVGLIHGNARTNNWEPQRQQAKKKLNRKTNTQQIEARLNNQSIGRREDRKKTMSMRKYKAYGNQCDSQCVTNLRRKIVYGAIPIETERDTLTTFFEMKTPKPTETKWAERLSAEIFYRIVWHIFKYVTSEEFCNFDCAHFRLALHQYCVCFRISFAVNCKKATFQNDMP